MKIRKLAADFPRGTSMELQIVPLEPGEHSL